MLNRLQTILKEEGLEAFKAHCYAYAQHFEHCCILDSCQLSAGKHAGEYELLAAFGADQSLESYKDLKTVTNSQQWLFGVISYDLKNHFEALSSNNFSYIDQSEVAMFIPTNLLSLTKDGMLYLECGSIDERFGQSKSNNYSSSGLEKVNHIDKDDYVNHINQIKQRITEGEVYELNYCVQHQYRFDDFDPLSFHRNLIAKSPVPMASYLSWGNKYLCGASMERFLSKHGNTLISQPIKGTMRKGKDKEEDEELKTALYRSEKDRAENVMIVDLVRNDLAKLCHSGSIQVDELFGIYSYLQVHQMISTISGELKITALDDILRATFPMGSMTGAPKIAAMKHIEDLEVFKRGWYSGSIGYVKPNGDFDLNVVIRSLICDTENKRLAYSAGGAITIDSVAESEWLECLLKTKAIESILLD